ncbi:MAG: hypothetical protein ACK40G_05195 [Cytophagaceae bacterium]
MKNFISISITLILSISLALAFPPDKVKTKNFILKTNRALGVSHMVVKKTKKMDGKLALAVRHERLAKQFYNNGNLERALHHSARSRALADQIMKDNGAKATMDHAFTAEENSMLAGKPSDAELDTTLDKELPGELKDADLMNGGLDVDLKEDGSY